MNKVNYQKLLDKIIDDIIAEKENDKQFFSPSLLLHSCCAPCSSYVLSYLSDYFDISVLYYNPNITENSEYKKRKAEQLRFISVFNEKYAGIKNPVKHIDCDWEPKEFLEVARGLEKAREGGERCFKCYELRLRKTAAVAKERGFDYFGTTLSISPYKNAQKLNEIGEELAAEYGVKHLPADFKKKNGYKISIQMSKEYGLYRQDYCGCYFSKLEREVKTAAERSR